MDGEKNERRVDPLHGIKLATIVEELQKRYGWEELALQIPIRCFENEPSIKSSLKFLRRTPWARSKVEALYRADLAKAERNRKRNKRRSDQRAFRLANEAAEAGEE